MGNRNEEIKYPEDDGLEKPKQLHNKSCFQHCPKLP
jgi:hypothetical protein